MINKKNISQKRLILILLCFSILSLQVLNAVPLLIAPDDQDCQEKLDQAEESYYNGDLDPAILLVRQCLEDPSISKDTRVRAYKILARCHLAQDKLDLAKKAISLILQLEPNYQPTLEEESPRFVDLVTEIRAEQAQLRATQESTGTTPWIWIGAGGVAAVAVIVIVATGSGGEENNNTTNTRQPLSPPPALP